MQLIQDNVELVMNRHTGVPDDQSHADPRLIPAQQTADRLSRGYRRSRPGSGRRTVVVPASPT